MMMRRILALVAALAASGPAFAQPIQPGPVHGSPGNILTFGPNGRPADSQTAVTAVQAPLFGTGADGSVTVSSGTTTLTRDMHYSNLTINGTGTIIANGYRIFVSGTLDISGAQTGAITWGNGGQPTGTIAASSSPNWTVPATGGTGIGPNGNQANSFGAFAFGGDNGAGGAGGSGANAGGNSGAQKTAVYRVTNPQFTTPQIFPIWILGGNSSIQPITGGISGSTGGAGGGDGTNSGGSSNYGGWGGGQVYIFANTIYRGTNANAGIIAAKGVNGAAGSSSTEGNTGGGGGGGGFAYVVANHLTGSLIIGAIDVSGGNGGAGGNGFGTGKGGNGGYAGYGGNYAVIVLNPGSAVTGTANTAPSTSPGTATTTAGASGGTAATVQGNL